MIKSGVELVNDLLDNKTVDLKNPNCNNCNECCSALTIITTEEFEFYKKHFRSKGKNLFKECMKKHIEKEVKNNAINLTCPFSSKTKRCLIYNIRPRVCKEFHCSPTLNKLNIAEVSSVEHYSIFKLLKALNI